MKVFPVMTATVSLCKANAGTRERESSCKSSCTQKVGEQRQTYPPNRRQYRGKPVQRMAENPYRVKFEDRVLEAAVLMM